MSPPLPARESDSVAAEAMDEAAIAFGWARGGSGLEEEAGPALFGQKRACCATLLSFAVEGLSDGSGTADLAEGEDVDLEEASFGLDGEAIPNADFAGRAQRLMVCLDAIQFTSFGGQGACFEEARGPEPFVEAHEDSVNPAREKAAS